MGNNSGDRELFRLARNISGEESESPKQFQVMISNSLDQFFLKKRQFDPNNCLIYADYLEEQGEIDRAAKLRKNSEDLAKFAGREGMRYLDRNPTREIWESTIRNFSVFNGRRDLVKRIEKELNDPAFSFQK